MRKIALLLTLLAPLTLTHCKRETAQIEQVERVVWSDDNTQVAMIVSRFDETTSSNPLDGASIRNNVSHQIYIRDREGGTRQALGNEVQGQNASELYFMKTAGYLIASYLENDENGQAVVSYYKMTLDGNVSRLTYAPHMRVIPSADAQYLAVLTQSPEACNGGHDCPLEVSFLKADDLSAAGTHSLSFSNGLQPEVTWNLSGQFIASSGDEHFALRPHQAEVDNVSAPQCVYPVTSSSSIATSGDFVYPQANQVAFRSTTANEQPFGCQD